MDFRIENGSVTFWLKVKPRSARAHLMLDSSGELRLTLHAAPTEGQANDACIRFFARRLRVPRSSVEIVRGEKARRKLIRIRGGVEIATALKATVAQTAPTGQEAQRTTDRGQRTSDI